MLQRGAELVIHQIRAAQGLGTVASSGWIPLTRGRQLRSTSLWEQALRSWQGRGRCIQTRDCLRDSRRARPASLCLLCPIPSHPEWKERSRLPCAEPSGRNLAQTILTVSLRGRKRNSGSEN